MENAEFQDRVASLLRLIERVYVELDASSSTPSSTSLHTIRKPGPRERRGAAILFHRLCANLKVSPPSAEDLCRALSWRDVHVDEEVARKWEQVYAAFRPSEVDGWSVIHLGEVKRALRKMTGLDDTAKHKILLIASSTRWSSSLFFR